MLKVGDQAPDLSLKNEKGDLIQLSDYKGNNIVLYFYPKDDTPGCTKQAQAFSEKINEFKSKNTVILGVSKDSIKSHEKFCNKYNLQITLLSDPELKVIQAYGVWKEKKLYGKAYMGVERTTFIIDVNGKIVEIYNKVKVADHVQNVLLELK